MSESLYIAASGMHAQQLNIDVIANNLANVNTTAFKKSRVQFEDLMYREITKANGLVGDEQNSHAVGVGTGVSNTSKEFSMGEIKQTQRPLDLAINGNGFYEVVLPDGSYGYTRSGSFHVDSDGYLASNDGYIVSPLVQIPADTEQVLINPDGTVKVQVSGEDELIETGRIELAKFVNPAGLNPMGDNLYIPTQQSGDALYSVPGRDGTGVVAQGFLESSNVTLVEELTNLILAQRAYEINSKVVQASDEMMSIVNNLRR
ncbi:MAG: flagellar basal-body rod protein FlgG [Gammaproteobacteria bacterium]|jgi:flagellar basal-body rod protein FlgG